MAHHRPTMNASPLTTKGALLGALSYAPGYAAQLIAFVEHRSDGVIRLSTGSVYGALRELTAEGFLTIEMKPQVDNRGHSGSRAKYTITPAGHTLALAYRRAVIGLFQV